MQFSTLQTYSKTKPRVFYEVKANGFDDAVFGTPKVHETISENRGAINEKKNTGKRKLLGSQNTNVTRKNPRDSRQRKRRILAKKRAISRSGAFRLSQLAIETVDTRMQRTREWLESDVSACNHQHNDNSTNSSIELFRKDQSVSTTQKKKLNDLQDFSVEELTNEMYCLDRSKKKLKQCDLEPGISIDHPLDLGVTGAENENFCHGQLIEITPLICTLEEKLESGSEGEPSLIMRHDVPKYLSSTKQKSVAVSLDFAAEWADLSSIAPSPRTAAYRARMTAETTPCKISQPSTVNAPAKVRQPQSKWKRGSQPLSSTCLFKSPNVEIVDCAPDVSSIRSRDGVSMSDVCLAEQKNQMFTQEGVRMRKSPDLSYKLSVHDRREPTDMERRKIEEKPVKVLTSTPAKDCVSYNLLEKLQIDVSFVPPPSSDEDAPLDFNHSPKTVNSDEIAPFNLEELEDTPCSSSEKDEEVPTQANMFGNSKHDILFAKQNETKASLVNAKAIDIASHSTRRRANDVQVIRISDRIICPITNPYIFLKQKKNTLQILQKTSPLKSRSKEKIIPDIICILRGTTKRTCLNREAR